MMDQTPQIPRGHEHLKCPFWKKAMSEVCHKCPMWVLVRGKNPQTHGDVDRWNCAISWLPLLLVENSQMSRQTGAAVESFRNEMIKRNPMPTANDVIKPMQPLIPSYFNTDDVKQLPSS